jgi:hypothetical protein
MCIFQSGDRFDRERQKQFEARELHVPDHLEKLLEVKLHPAGWVPCRCLLLQGVQNQACDLSADPCPTPCASALQVGDTHHVTLLSHC